MNERPNASTVRQYCDGELSPAQAQQLQSFMQQNPQERERIEAQIEFEQGLRSRVEDILGQVKAPSALRERIRTAMAADAENPDVLARIDRGTAKARLSRVKSLRTDRMNIFAVAATLALIAGAVLYGIFGRTIDEVPVQRPVDLVSELAEYAGHEHDECTASNDCLSQHARFSAAERAEALLTDWLSAPVQVADLQPLGYDFLGAGPCQMPVDVHSGHLVYRKRMPDGARSPMVSVFVFPNMRPCGTKVCEGGGCGEWEVVADEGSRCRHKVMRSTDGKLVYLLVCCNGRDLGPVAEQIGGNLRAHELPTARP